MTRQGLLNRRLMIIGVLACLTLAALAWGLQSSSGPQAAVNSALADCARRDSDCHVIAIGPFTVGPIN